MFNNEIYNRKMDIEYLLRNPIKHIYIFPKTENIFLGIIFVRQGVYKGASFTFTLYYNYGYSTGLDSKQLNSELISVENNISFNKSKKFNLVKFDENLIHPLVTENNEFFIEKKYSLHSTLKQLKAIFLNENIFLRDKSVVNLKSCNIILNTSLFIEEISKNIIFTSQTSLKKNFLINHNNKIFCNTDFEQKSKILKKMEEYNNKKNNLDG